MNTELISKLNARIVAINTEKADSTAAHNLRITKLNVELETTQNILKDLDPTVAETAPAVPAPPATKKRNTAAKTTGGTPTEGNVKTLHKPTVAGGAPAASTGKKAKVVATFAEATTLQEKIYFILSQIKKGTNKAIIEKMAEYQEVNENIAGMVRQATSKAKIEGLLEAVDKEGLAHVYAIMS